MVAVNSSKLWLRTRSARSAQAGSVLSAGVAPGTPAVLHYVPRGPAVDALPATPYTVDDVLADYSLAAGATDDFLAIVLARLEAHYGLTDFASDRQVAFEAFLQSVDLDDEAPGLQPYLDPGGTPILTLADTLFFGPSESWPKELANHPYIHFWHQLDEALAAHGLPGMGSELMGDDVWSALFAAGPLVENPDIRMNLGISTSDEVAPSALDQTGSLRPVGGAADVGAIEKR